MQAINTLEKSLDHLRSFPNVLLSTTSNLTSLVDIASLVCANLKVFVGLPFLEARYEILKGCLMEFVHVGIVQDHGDVFCDSNNVYNMVNEQDSLSQALFKCAKDAEALSA
jgi:hypothetical protein